MSTPSYLPATAPATMAFTVVVRAVAVMNPAVDELNSVWNTGRPAPCAVVTIASRAADEPNSETSLSSGAEVDPMMAVLPDVACQYGIHPLTNRFGAAGVAAEAGTDTIVSSNAAATNTAHRVRVTTQSG